MTEKFVYMDIVLAAGYVLRSGIAELSSAPTGVLFFGDVLCHWYVKVTVFKLRYISIQSTL